MRVLAPLMLASVASADPKVPVPLVSADRDHVESVTPVGETLTIPWTITNRSGCSVRLGKGRSPTGVFRADCPRWTLLDDEQMQCEITAASAKPGTAHDMFVVVAQVGEDCKTAPLVRLAERMKLELEPLIAEYERARTVGGAEKDRRAKEADLAARLAEREKELAARVTTLDAEAKAKVKTLEEVWLDVQRQHDDRIARQRQKIAMIDDDNSAMTALDAQLAEMRKKAEKEIDAAHAKRIEACAVPGKLRLEKDKLLAEMRKGLFHSECGRTKSQIEAAGESLEHHLGRVGGTMDPANPEQLAAKTKEYDDKIAAAKQTCTDRTADENKMSQSWIDRIKALEGKRPDLVKAKEKVREKAQQDLAALINAKSAARNAHDARVHAVATQLEADLAEVARMRTRAKADHEAQRKAAHAEYVTTSRAQRDRGDELFQKVSNLRAELTHLDLAVRNAHLKPTSVQLLISVKFERGGSK